MLDNMKIFISLSLFFLSFSTFSQNLTVSASIRDSITSDLFFYHVSGKGVFGDSLVVHVELINQDDNSKVYEGFYDFTHLNQSTIPSFVYDLQSMDYSFDLGNYTKGNFLLHIWTTFGNEKKDELFYQE